MTITPSIYNKRRRKYNQAKRTLLSFHTCVAVLLLCAVHTLAQPASPGARWGQAHTISNGILYVHGGKTDPSNSYTYSSAPNSGDLFRLNLNQPFALESPPWEYIDTTTDGPTVAFHTISAFSPTAILLFGGAGGPSLPVSTRADSAWLFDISRSTWEPQEEGWANQPIRRVYHSAATSGENVYITGGERADLSLIGYQESYLYTSSSQQFTALPTANGPPDLVGHASVVLPNGLLLVFGGFSRSLNSPLPFSTIFVLDTASTSPSWRNVTVSGSLPRPRRNFAVAVLQDGRILIHGGTDDTFQTVYDDGAVLDTSETSPQWAPVSGLSSGLGARFGHVAIAVGEQVLFCLGYGANGPAPATLSLFDVSTDSFVQDYTPPPPTTTTPPSQPTTRTSGQHSTGLSGSRPPFDPGPTGPTTSHSGPSPTGSEEVGTRSRPNLTAIALGSVFGVLALVALTGGATYYYLRRRDGEPVWPQRHGSGGSWSLVREDGEKPVAIGFGAQRQGWGMLSNLGRRGPPGAGRQRFDILADEDAREFDVDTFAGIRRGLSGSSSEHGTYSGSRSRGLWNDAVNASVSSLRSVGAVIGFTTPKPPIPQTPGWDKENVPLDPFSDSSALFSVEGEGTGATTVGMAALAKSRPRPYPHQREASTSSMYSQNTPPAAPHTDPFADNPIFVDETTPFASASDTLPRSIAVRALSPLTEVASRASSGEQPGSSSTHDAALLSGSATLKGSSSSHESSAKSGNAKVQRRTSLLDQPPIEQPIKRSDSWWTRFSRTAFLERSLSHSFHDGHRERAASDALIDFRDPNPPPRLSAIEESSTSNSPDTPVGPPPDAIPAYLRTSSGKRARRRSLSSIQTADTETIERMGTMDVVQRVRTTSSHHTATPSVPGTPIEEWPDLPPLPERRPSRLHVDTTQSPPLTSQLVTSPFEDPPQASVSSPQAVKSPAGPRPPPVSFARKGTGTVAARVQAYERRMSQDVSPTTPTSSRPPPRLTKTVDYGLVPKPSLYVANPDRKGSTPSDG